MTQKWNRIDKNLCKFEKKLESLTRCLLDKPVSNSFVFALIFDICFYFRGQSHRVELYKILSSMFDICFYFRGQSHRVELYKILSSMFDICLYFRGQSHRVELYKILSSMNLHVIAIDYRGNGSLQYI